MGATPYEQKNADDIKALKEANKSKGAKGIKALQARILKVEKQLNGVDFEAIAEMLKPSEKAKEE